LIFLTQGIVWGLYAAALPGPFQVFLLAQTLRVGWKRTLPAAFAPLLSDGPIIALLLIVLSQAPVWFLNALRLAGGIFILYLAYGAYRTFRSPLEEVVLEPGAGRQSLLKAALINLLNPNVYIFWGTIGAPIVLEGWSQSAWRGWSFFLGMYGTIVPATAAMIVLFGTTGRLKPAWRRNISGVLAALLLALGMFQLLRAATAFIG
jgi:threonine/homoserine/homoserine lactone efflux protein